jgi:hypothetical protein
MLALPAGHHCKSCQRLPFVNRGQAQTEGTMERAPDRIVIIFEGGLPRTVIATTPTEALLVDLDIEGAEDCELMRVGKNMTPAVVRIMEVESDPDLVKDYFDAFEKTFSAAEGHSP